MFVLPLLLSSSLLAQETGCPHAEATIQSLRDCVEHAALDGHIENRRVAQSLLAKLDAAQASLDRGAAPVAVNILDAFIHQVEALTTVQIDAVHAAHMVEHAEAVIQALLTET
jgi:hypothetical protein